VSSACEPESLRLTRLELRKPEPCGPSHCQSRSRSRWQATVGHVSLARCWTGFNRSSCRRLRAEPSLGPVAAARRRGHGRTPSPAPGREVMSPSHCTVQPSKRQHSRLRPRRVTSQVQVTEVPTTGRSAAGGPAGASDSPGVTSPPERSQPEARRECT
jgi:hypothetical protein